MEQDSSASESVPATDSAAADSAAARTAPTSRPGGRPRRVLKLVAILAAAALIWEALKWIAGDPWRLASIGYFHNPPFRISQFTDLELPHLWDVAAAFGQPFQGSGQYVLGQYLLDQAVYTLGVSVAGFTVGAIIGIVLASIFVHSGLLERAFVPYVVASQTVPIVALAPLLVIGLGRGVQSIVVIAAYLTFFPVTIAVTRGLRSPDPRAIELMRSYAASKWTIYRKVRLPASLPYLFTALKIAAAASVVGTIIGEGPGGGLQGLGRAILTFNQQYITGPERLWATIVVASTVGLIFYAAVRTAEIIVMRRRGGVGAGT
jgi:NitT/TauT family transport system permease protein